MKPKGLKKPAVAKTTAKTDGKAAPDTLSGEEQALWRYVATSITPIKAKHHVRKHGASIEALEVPEPAVPVRRPARAKSAPPAATAPAAVSVRMPATAARGTPPLADFDPRKAKKIGTGRAGIDARVDLHGLRQNDALARLRAFLFEAHARGHKTVLVITGKGRAEDDPTTPYVDTLDRFPRGVLRRNLPHWLAEPDLRAIVVSYTQASQRHGGDGAFYVELRRAR
jgi:DNA-nicking Smr family endonuclease